MIYQIRLITKSVFGCQTCGVGLNIILGTFRPTSSISYGAGSIITFINPPNDEEWLVEI